MDFTRDPIIETIISPRDGFKLSVRCSRQSDQESYCVNAVEVVSFGTAFFFRSLEKPNAFLFPVSDYEVTEVREARMVFKNVSTDKPIKIGEGKESKKPSAKAASAKAAPSKAAPSEKKSDEAESESVDGEAKKPGRKKNSRRRRSRKPEGAVEENKAADAQDAPAEGSAPEEDVPQKEVVLPVAPRPLPTPPKIIVRTNPVEPEATLEEEVTPSVEVVEISQDVTPPAEIEIVETSEEVQELTEESVEEVNGNKEAS